ncbi:MAG: nitronate monooxygenase [Bauldia litoralis]
MTDTLRARLGRLRIPAFAAPMFLVSGPDLVVAACRSGVVGSFPAPNARTTEILDAWLGEITSRLEEPSATGVDQAPWAVNMVVHSTTQRMPYDLEVVVKYKAPIVITALGSPARVVDEIHAYGGLVFADVNSVGYARKAVDAGVDGLVLVCSGAGGHTGQLCNFAFVDEVRRFWDGYIALGGGISTGRAIRAAEVMGADFAYIGTRFIATEESMAEQAYRDMLADCTAEDLMVSKAFTGANASMLVPSIVNQGLDPVELADKKAKMNFTGQEGMEVKPWKGIWTAGQGVGSIDGTSTVEDLVATLKREYDAAR